MAIVAGDRLLRGSAGAAANVDMRTSTLAPHGRTARTRRRSFRSAHRLRECGTEGCESAWMERKLQVSKFSTVDEAYSVWHALLLTSLLAVHKHAIRGLSVLHAGSW